YRLRSGTCCVNNPNPPCTPDCDSACGQADGCGSNCGNSDNGKPNQVALNPLDGAEINVEAGEQVMVSWSSANKADHYELELYQNGTDCTDVTAHCDEEVDGTSFSFDPLVSSYYYRVRGVNTSCTAYDGSDDFGDWAEAIFDIRGIVSGQVFLLGDEASAEIVGSTCSLTAGTASGIDLAGLITITGGYTAEIGADGLYSVLGVPMGSGKIATLNTFPYTGICPVAGTYGAVVSPMNDLDFYLSDQKDPWFQVAGGNLHANGGGVTSNIPSSAANPYLITGSTGLVSYTGGLDLGDGDINEIGEDWRAITSYDIVQTDYDYFYRILSEDPAGMTDWDGLEPTVNGVYTSNVSKDTVGAWDISSDQKEVILVDGDVLITDNIEVAQNGFLAIITSGNITVADTVTKVEGVYIADGIFSTCETASSLQFNGEGIFVGWGGVNLCRDFDSTDNNTTPVEVFIYRSDFLSSVYEYLMKPIYSWREVAP
ncbi:MAG: hypothetical protein U9Q63_02660, partial [Patescibacteria group bacterium]|nr:hypothetical protein [Patescibacteria group bacterium]